MSRKINKIDSRFEPLYRKNQEIIEHIYVEIDGIEKAIVLLSQKTEALPNMIQEDIHRSMLDLREYLKPTPPMKSNNWDSVRAAFKGPTRIEVNERT